MKIIIDLQGAQTTSSRNRGIGRYTLALAQAMARQAAGHEVWVALNRHFPDSIEGLRGSFSDYVPPERIVVWDSPGPVAAAESANHWRMSAGERLRESFLAALKPDIVHVTSLFEGHANDALTSIGTLEESAPTAVTLYDLIPLIHRDRYLDNPVAESWYETKLAHLRRAQLWLAISESARQEGIEWLHLPADRVINISSASDDRFRPMSFSMKEVEQVRRRCGLSRPFVMYTGGIDHRKNIDGLIGAYAKLGTQTRSNRQLAIVCSANQAQIRELKRHASRCGLANDEVVFTGYVSDADMVALYNLCTAFVFPSWHEGFGLPALEAMSCGAAVIAANTSSLPEVVGRSDALFNPHDTDDMAAKLQTVLTDGSFREELKRSGLRQAGSFSWDASARRALAAFEQLHSTRQDSQSRRTNTPARRRPTLAYVSPLPPLRTGISDYSAELLRELERHYDIEVVTDQDTISDPWIVVNCPQRGVAWFEKNAQRYDRILYHFGNSEFHKHMFSLLEKHPGTVVLHEFFLSGALAHVDFQQHAPGAWTEALYAAHGYGAVKHCFQEQSISDVNMKYPCNFNVIKHANGVIVHSRHSRVMADQWYGKDCSADWAQIPHLRNPVMAKERADTRAALDSEEDFLVCSFGMLGPTKLSHRLFEAWLSSPLADDPRCHLTFVGANYCGRYGEELVQAIERHGVSNRVTITGFASPTLYRTYLSAADAAVQLRTHSRGETSGAVLDCMNHGLATIVNAHGSMEDLSPDVALLLADEFTQHDLIDALTKVRRDPALRQTIGQRARLQIRALHHPWDIGNKFHEAIERFAESGPQTARMNLIQSLKKLDSTLQKDSDWMAVAKSIAFNHPFRKPTKQLLVDVSELLRCESKPGMQREVRHVLKELFAKPPEDYRIEPVFARPDGIYRYARSFTLKFLGCPDCSWGDDPIETGCGDIFLGLSLSPTLAPQCAGAIADMKNRGTAVYFISHDLLCANRPEFSGDGDLQTFTHWMRHLAGQADRAICTSCSRVDLTDLAALDADGPCECRSPVQHAGLAGTDEQDAFSDNVVRA